MKRLNKLFSVLLALTMAAALAIPAFADGETGSITIKDVTKDQTYTAYKIFDLDYSSTDETKEGETVKDQWGNTIKIGYAYTATEDQKTFYEKYNSSTPANPFTFTKNTTGNYNVSVATGKTDPEVIAFLQSFITVSEDGKVTLNGEFEKVVTKVDDVKKATATGENESVTINVTSYGYYLVTSTVGTVVTVNSTTPNVTVEDKNTEVTADKDVKEGGNYGNSSDAGIGDTVEFRTKITIPVGSVNVVLHDKMSDGLDFNEGSVKVYKDDTLTTDLDDSYYSEITDVSEKEEPCDFEVEFTQTYLDSLKTETNVWVHYTAVVTEDAVIKGEGNTNSTYVSFGENNNITSTPSETKTYVWSFDLHKYADDNTTGYLADAEFVLWRYQSDESTKEYAVFTTSQTTNSNDTYLLGGTIGNETVYWTTEANATKIKTIGSGKIDIEGLDDGTYYLTETKAPDGYNALTEDITVIIKGTEDTSAGTRSMTLYKGSESDENKVSEIQVQNQSGTVLPSTGGIGTTIFYVIGGLLVIGAGIALITKKRMRNRG